MPLLQEFLSDHSQADKKNFDLLEIIHEKTDFS